MRLKRQITSMGLLLALLGSGPAIFGQEDPAAAPAAADEGGDKRPFALYVEAATGGFSADTLSTDLATLSTHVSEGRLMFDDIAYAKAAVGWKLQHGRGDFRINFNGYREDNYLFSAYGLAAVLDPAAGTPAQTSVLDNLLWWTLQIENGHLESERTPPWWVASLDDANVNGAVDGSEVRYPLGADIQLSKDVADDLQNRIQFVDLLFGRTFGSRTFSARWWGGMRYFVYEGNIPAAAWLGGGEPGAGFTDGFLVRLMQLSQETKGFGPTGILEADFKMLDERLVFYLQGQIALMMLDLEMDSGPFLTYVTETTNLVTVPVDGYLRETRNKSTWQDAAEVGVRVHLKNGLQLEVAYNITGLLDVVLHPTEIQIPSNLLEAPQGSSALYNTQDFVLDGWRAGFAFQF
jgi:hypothetical protein